MKSKEIPVVGCRDTDRKIVLLGDSITEEGGEPSGWITLVETWARNVGIDVELNNAGISGDQVIDVIRRVSRDVIQHSPDFVVIAIGINDAWQWESLPVDGSMINQFRSEMETLVDRLLDAHIRVCLCTPGIIGERSDGHNACDYLLDVFADIIRSLAETKNTGLIDLRIRFVETLKKVNPGQHEYGFLTRDGVHLNKSGHRFYAGIIFDSLWPGVRSPEIATNDL